MKLNNFYKLMPYPDTKPAINGDYVTFDKNGYAHTSYFENGEFYVSDLNKQKLPVVNWLCPIRVHEHEHGVSVVFENGA